jgi:predicted dienelactone hydrolase
MGANVSTVMIVVALVTGLWWGFARGRRKALLERFSVAALALAVVTLVLEGLRWQLVPWQVLALAVAAAAAFRRWRPGRSRRWRRVIGRAVLLVGLALGGVVLLTALVPTLPKPSGPHRVGSVIFRWTDNTRPETFTADRSDRRQVIAQAWYPTDAKTGRAVPYFEAQGRLPSSIGGLPSFMFASFGSVATHATAATPVSAAQRTWPVLFFSTGLSVPREQYTALCTDLASRGYVVVALSVPYESGVTVLVDGRVVGQTFHPNVMGPPPHPALERLIDIRVADTRFALDQLSRLAQIVPHSPLAGHLDFRHVGIVGHSIGGATAVQVMASDPRFRVGVDLDGKLFGSEPDSQLERPFLWVQADDTKPAEYTNGRDRFLAQQGGRGTLLTIRKSMHMSFSDAPSYLTPVGRRLIGATAGIGQPSLADMTSMTGDAISSFVGPALGVKDAGSLQDVLVLHPDIRLESRIVRTATESGALPAPVLDVPAPTGAFHVGTRSIALTDRARREPEAPTRPRSLVIQLWYPAAAATRSAPYVPPAVARYLASSAGLQTAVLDTVKLDATADTQPLTRKGGWPVVLFSPGFGVERGLYAGLVEDLASHGYLVVAIDHPHDAGIVEFPDGHVVAPSSQLDIANALSVRVADTRFVLTELARLDSAGAFVGRLDLGHVGMFGHSLGGAAAASTMLVDSRIDAGADLDGVLFGSARARGLSRPFLLMSGEPGFAADPNRASFWSHLRGPHYAVDIKGAQHFAFSDLVFFTSQLMRSNRTAAETAGAQVGHVDGPSTLAAERAYLLAFFDRFLRGKQAPLLTRTRSPFAGVRATVASSLLR